VIEVDETCPTSRDEIVAALQAENILARKYFWPGAHRMQPYQSLYPHAGLLLPNTRKVADRVVVLPNGTALPDDAAGMIGSIITCLVNG